MVAIHISDTQFGIAYRPQDNIPIKIHGLQVSNALHLYFHIKSYLMGETMKSMNYMMLLLTCFLLQACSPDNSPKPKLFEEQRSALDKAKAVDGTVQQQTQQLQQSVDKQTQ